MPPAPLRKIYFGIFFFTLWDCFWGVFLSCKTDWKLKYKHLENEGARAASLPSFKVSGLRPLCPLISRPTTNNMLYKQLIASIIYMHTHIMHLECSQWLWLWYWESGGANIGALYCILAEPIDVNYQWSREVWLAHQLSYVNNLPKAPDWSMRNLMEL